LHGFSLPRLIPLPQNAPNRTTVSDGR